MEFIDDRAAHPFTFIEPPFQQNAINVAAYPPEVSGNQLLQCMAKRLGWRGLSGKRILDVGCGVRFARTIVNLGLDVGLYVGIDINRELIAWLQANVSDGRLVFAHTNDHNALYNPDGDQDGDLNTFRSFSERSFDVACMFSVITHERPSEARRTFTILREVVGDSGLLYFTAFINSRLSDYGEGTKTVGQESTYNAAYLTELLTACGWTIDRVYLPGFFQQHAFVCSPK